MGKLTVKGWGWLKDGSLIMASNGVIDVTVLRHKSDADKFCELGHKTVPLTVTYEWPDKEGE